MSAVKACSKCGETKAPTEFSRAKGSSDGLRANCKACDAVSRRRYYEENRERGRRRREENLETERERERHSRERNREKRREYNRRWRAENPERRREYARVNAEAGRVRHRNWRAHLRSADGTHNIEDLVRTADEQGMCCLYCGVPSAPDVETHVDHMTPLSRGGSNWPENLALTCGPCNLSKGVKTAEEFREYLRVVAWPPPRRAALAGA
jgi:5-methylcytosine-specific restriction endonuclease McrA